MGEKLSTCVAHYSSRNKVAANVQLREQATHQSVSGKQMDGDWLWGTCTHSAPFHGRSKNFCKLHICYRCRHYQLLIISKSITLGTEKNTTHEFRFGKTTMIFIQT